MCRCGASYVEVEDLGFFFYSAEIYVPQEPPVNQSAYDECREILRREREGIQDSKRPGYTLGNQDVLKNFKSVAERVGITPGQVWTVYFLKHVDALISGMCRPELPVSEPLIGRFSDLMNYCELGFAIFSEPASRQLSSPLERTIDLDTLQDLRQLPLPLELHLREIHEQGDRRS